jgi:hypothetical protein
MEYTTFTSTDAISEGVAPDGYPVVHAGYQMVIFRGDRRTV